MPSTVKYLVLGNWIISGMLQPSQAYLAFFALLVVTTSFILMLDWYAFPSASLVVYGCHRKVFSNILWMSFINERIVNGSVYDWRSQLFVNRIIFNVRGVQSYMFFSWLWSVKLTAITYCSLIFPYFLFFPHFI